MALLLPHVSRSSFSAWRAAGAACQTPHPLLAVSPPAPKRLQPAPYTPGRNTLPGGQGSLTCTRSGRRWLSMARYPSRLCSTGVCDTARLASPSADRHRLPGQGARGQEGPGSRAQVPPRRPSPSNCTAGTAASVSSQTGPSCSLSPGSPAAVRGPLACEAWQGEREKQDSEFPVSALTTGGPRRRPSLESVLTLPPPSNCGDCRAQCWTQRTSLPAPMCPGEMLYSGRVASFLWAGPGTWPTGLCRCHSQEQPRQVGPQLSVAVRQ